MMEIGGVLCQIALIGFNKIKMFFIIRFKTITINRVLVGFDQIEMF